MTLTEGQAGGRLTSPGYPKSYNRASTCKYTLLVADEGKRLTISFSDFEMENPRNATTPDLQCAFDYVQVTFGRSVDLFSGI